MSLPPSQASLLAAKSEALCAALGGRHDPEAPGGPCLVHVSAFNSGARRRETEIDALVRHGVLDERHVAASQVFIALMAQCAPGGRDSVEALQASIGGAPPHARHRAQMRLVEAGEALRATTQRLRNRVGSQGAAIVIDICNGTSAAAIAVGLGFTRAGRIEARGDATKAHGLIRMGFDALAAVMLADARPPRRFGERVDLGETRKEIEIIYAGYTPTDESGA